MNARCFFSALVVGGLLSLRAPAATFVAPSDLPAAAPASAAALPAHPVAIVPLQAAATPPAGRASAPTLRLDGAAAHWDFLPARQAVPARRVVLPPALARN